jgi:flagellar M-ring protein FliF
VTVVDQQGRLLNAKDSSLEMAMNSKQFEYKKQLEEHLIERIENILMPLLGDGMRVQVTADVDFTITEKTQELFNPDLPALRSEQTSEEQNTLSAVQGVPGALSNQPPPAGIAPEVADGAGENNANSAAPKSASKTATRNYELDKTITHTRMASGELRRLSVAVVVDNQRILQADGTSSNQPYSEEDINRLKDLVKQAVGFDINRGDQVTVSNVAFLEPEIIEDLPEIPLWEQGWFIDLMKQVVGVLVVLLLVFGVLRPAMRGLIGRVDADKKALGDSSAGAVRYDDKGKPVAVPVADEGPKDFSKMEKEDLLLLEAPQSYEKRLEYVKKLVDEDAKLVAQVVKTWVAPSG